MSERSITLLLMDIKESVDNIITFTGHHHYFGIDNSIVWDIIQSNLPELRKHITELLAKEKPE